MFCSVCQGAGYVWKASEIPTECFICDGTGATGWHNRFEKFSKIRRLDGLKMWITEKIDGTNSQIFIDRSVRCVGSRNRAIQPDVPAARHPWTGRTVRDDQGKPVFPKRVLDNFGFAAQVYQDREALPQVLGEGLHFGEWAGPGIQKNPLDLPERLFFLFSSPDRYGPEKLESVPWLRLVPFLYEGSLDFEYAYDTMIAFQEEGTRVPDAGPDAKAPEGIIIATLDHRFKITPDPRPKGAR